MRTTIKDVAEAAGVSAMAVSAVLNGTKGNVKVSPVKAELIRKVARELNYRPNHLAQSLRSRETKTIALVFQHLDRFGDDRPYFPQLFNGVLPTLFEAGYTMALCPKLIEDGDTRSISDGRFDGVLWCRPDFDEASLEAIRTATIPVVMVHAPAGSVPGVPAFCADNDAAMKMAVAHLKELGHQNLAFLISQVDQVTAEGRARRKAFETAAIDLGVGSEIIVWSGDELNVRAELIDERNVTGVICFSDTLAGQLLEACLAQGVNIPAELSVVGFDSSPFCDRTQPKLTSINQPVEEMVAMATKHLLSLIRESSEESSSKPGISFLFDCGLDVRESTAPSRTQRRVII